MSPAAMTSHGRRQRPGWASAERVNRAVDSTMSDLEREAVEQQMVAQAAPAEDAGDDAEGSGRVGGDQQRTTAGSCQNAVQL